MAAGGHPLDNEWRLRVDAEGVREHHDRLQPPPRTPPVRPAAPAASLDSHHPLTSIVTIYTYSHYMTRKVLHSFYLDPDLTDGLKVASEAEYMPQSQIVRLAIR